MGWMEASNDLLASGQHLRDRLERDGYLLLRGVLPRAEVR
jgi:hypothetical protein